MERDHGGHAVDDELVERAARALQGLGAVAAGDDELGDQGVERARDGLALVVAAVDADAGAGGGLPAGQGAGGGHEVAAAVLGVDAVLDGVAADLGVVVAELLAGGDAEHLADQVDAGDLLGDRVLDLEAGVDLEEGDGAVLADQELAGAGADVAGLAAGSPWRTRRAGSIWSSVRNGAGASSTSFWWRRCSEQSRVETTTTLPCWSARHWVSTWRGLSRNFSTKHSPRPNGADRLADRGLEGVGDLLQRAGDLEAAAAATEGGLDRDRQAVLLGEGDDLVGVRRPGPWCRRQGGADLLGDVAGP